MCGTFTGCISLTNIAIPNSVTTIERGAFSGCTGLTSIAIPSSVTNIDGGAFSGCSGLSAIMVDAGNAPFMSEDGVLFDKGQTTLVLCPAGKAGRYAIPTSVTSIGQGAFGDCTRLINVTIPDGVTSIGHGAFYGCTGLTNITIPNSVTNIGDGAFSVCTSLINVTIPYGVTSIGHGAFSVCTSLTSVTIGISVTNIEFAAFADCISLTNVTILSRATNIPGAAFARCTSLRSITIPDSVTNIEGYAFDGCTGLTGVYFRGNAPSPNGLVFYASKPTVYYLPGTTGWSATYEGRPTARWARPDPLILTGGSNLGVRANGFGFTISWATNAPVVVEASPDLTNPTWSPVSTNSLTDGSAYFTDPRWTNSPARFYRLRSP